MNILACFFQAGGYNGLEPFLRRAAVRGRVTLAGREAVRRSCNLDAGGFVPVRDLLSPDYDFAPYDVALTDTINLSRMPEAALCRDVWRKAAESGIASLAFVDSWWGYDERFILPGEHTPPLLPETIAVVDSLAAGEMVRRGYPRERVKILGSPLFETLSARGARRQETALAVREALGMEPDAFLVVFVSQPLEHVLGTHNGWGFTEKSILAEVLRSLEGLQEPCGGVRFVILPHPEEDLEGLRRCVSSRATDMRVHVLARNRIPNHDLLLAADLVLGMFSILLVEAVILRRPVLSVQLGLGREDMLVTNMVGATRALRDRQTLHTALARAVTDGGFREELLREHERFVFRRDACAAWEAETLSLAQGRLRPEDGRGFARLF